MSAHRAGVVALLGLPNAGKSTLLNRILGEKIAIVTRKAQTTRSRILGITTREDTQILWTDTPGIHRGGKPLDLLMREAAEEVAGDCDVALLLVDLTKGPSEVHPEWLARLQGKPVFLVGTKDDHPKAAECTWPPRYAEALAGAPRISAKNGTGVTALVEAVAALLPEAPPYYNDGELTDRPMRFLAAELVREAAFEHLQQELPYAVAVAIQDYDESDRSLIRIRANLLVERDSQKRIAVGRGGEVIKAIGVQARRGIEALTGIQVHLALRVKVDPAWSKGAKRLKSLGYH
jgi:GTP-binding protein Era